MVQQFSLSQLGQTFNLSLPDDGQVFRSTGGKTIYKRVGNDIIIFDTQEGAKNREFEQATGLTIENLPQFNLGDIQTALERINPNSLFVKQRTQGGNTGAVINDATQFKQGLTTTLA